MSASFADYELTSANKAIVRDYNFVPVAITRGSNFYIEQGDNGSVDQITLSAEGARALADALNELLL